jgi:DNA-binding cell septation regulator SpoVG
MNIELVEFYDLPIDKKHKKRAGTLHIYLIDYQIDIRGIRVIFNKSRMYVNMPARTGIDPETGEKVIYPVFSFTDHNKNKEIVVVITEKLRKFLQEKESQSE